MVSAIKLEPNLAGSLAALSIDKRTRDVFQQPLELQSSRINDPRARGVSALDPPDAVELLAAPLQIRFHRFGALGRHDQNHSHAEIEGPQHFLRLDFPGL